jgi:hypothetical protein
MEAISGRKNLLEIAADLTVHLIQVSQRANHRGR